MSIKAKLYPFGGCCLALLIFGTQFHFHLDEFLDNSGQDLAQCCYRLLDSDVFQQNTLAVTNSIIERAIQVSFLLPSLPSAAS